MLIDGIAEVIVEYIACILSMPIVGIVRPKDGVAATSISGTIGYTKELTEYILEETMKQDIVKQQLADPEEVSAFSIGFPSEKFLSSV